MQRRLTTEEARQHIGRAVVYVPVHGKPETGVITSVGKGKSSLVFVRYSGDSHSKGTLASDLVLLTGDADGEN